MEPVTVAELAKDRDSQITLPYGLPGFESIKQMGVVAVDDSDTLFLLAALDGSDVQFFAINPWAFFDDFELSVRDEDLDVIGRPEPNDVYVLALVAVREDGSKTANLRAPIVVNAHLRLARQVVADSDEWGMSVPIDGLRTDVS